MMPALAIAGLPSTPTAAQCAQFLVDTQCKNGQWSYGQKLDALKDVTVGAPPAKETASVGAGKPRPALKRVTIKKTADGPETGDNSNSQYAALGLRACHDAGIVIPEATVSAAIKSWKEAIFTETDRGN